MIGRFHSSLESVRSGINAGLVAGFIIVFLILIGVPVRITSLALFLFLLVIVIFSVRLARRLEEQGTAHVVRNALALGIAAGVLPFLLMSLINHWQATGTDVKQYFDSVSTKTTSVLSGVPESELGPNPPRDPITGDYPEGRTPRTDPMRLTFDPEHALVLALGLTGDPLFEINLRIGGFYGFMLLLVSVALLGVALTLATIHADLARYRRRVSGALAGNPVAHWIVLLLPLLTFALFWLTKGQGGGMDPLLSLGSSAQQVQLFLTFLLVLVALIALRAAQPKDWGLSYAARAGMLVGIISVLAVVAIGRMRATNAYFIAPPSEPGGSATYSTIAVIVTAAIMIAASLRAVRVPEQFESLFVGVTSLAVLSIMPLYLNQYQNDVLTIVGINVLLGLGLNIVVGYAGLLDLGYVAFFALGAYTYAFLSSNQTVLDANNQPAGLKFAGNDEMVAQLGAWVVTTVIVAGLVIAGGMRLWYQRQAARQRPSSQRKLVNTPPRPSNGTTALLILLAVGTSIVVALLLDRSGLYDRLFSTPSPFLIGLIVGVLVSGIAGIMLGIPVLRLRGDYLAIVTLGFGEIIRLLFTNLRDFTGGPQGILQIPRPLPETARGPVTYLSMVYLVLIGAALVAFFSSRLKASRTGRAWGAMRSDESIAQSMGVHLVQSKLMAFAIGAAFAGVGGVLFAARQRNIYPADFRLDISIEVLSLVIIGGMGSIPGVIMGAVVLIGIPEMLRELSTYRILVFGALLVAIVIVRPSGLLPAPPPQLQERARQLAHQRKESLP